MIFSDRIAHEHGVEGGHLVDAHARHANDLGHVVHGADWQPAAILTLGQIKQRNHLQEITTKWNLSMFDIHSQVVFCQLQKMVNGLTIVLLNADGLYKQTDDDFLLMN
jgi:hypothetical protein